MATPKAASLRPSEYEGASAPASLKAFEPEGQREDRLNLTVPFPLRWPLDELTAPGRPLSHVALWAMSEGLTKMERWPEVSTTCTGIDALRRAGAVEAIRELENSGHSIAPRGGLQESLSLRNVSPKIAGRCLALARELGLKNANRSRSGKGTIATLAMMVGLDDIPLPEPIARDLSEEVEAFRDWCRRRAARAVELRTKEATSQPRLRVSMRDLEKKKDDGG